MIKTHFDVLLIGSGAAATAVAIRLLQFTSKPISVVAVERYPQRRNGGMAYGGPGTTWSNIYNIQAGRLSMFREDVDDFLNWANHETDRKGWPDQWAQMTFTVSGPAPRTIYTDYLATRLSQAVQEAPEGSVYREEVGSVFSVVPTDDGDWNIVRIRVQEGTGEAFDRKLYARHVVIATGNEFRSLSFTEHCREHPSFIRLQYSQDGFARMRQVRADDTVVIIGSALSGYDAALTLYKDLGHRGPVYMLSRHGTPLQCYPKDHRHAVVSVRRPPFLDKGYRGVDELIDDVRMEFEYLCTWLARERPEIPAEVYSERILKAWEPFIPELVSLVPPLSLRHLLQEYNTVISNMRVGVMADTFGAVIDSDLSLLTAHIKEIVPNDRDGLTVHYETSDGPQSIDADLVISNLNRETDYALVKNQVWRNLIDNQELATPEKSTGRGVEVGPYGELVSASGKRSRRIYTVGLPREGDEIARNGRLGAFAFNIATLKNHSIVAALRIVSHLEAGADGLPEDTELSPKALRSDSGREEEDNHLYALFDKAVALKIHSLSSRRRLEKRQIENELLAAQRQLAEISKGSSTVLEKWLYHVAALVTHEAMKRMTDVSVTPLELRHRLGLDSAAQQDEKVGAG